MDSSIFNRNTWLQQGGSKGDRPTGASIEQDSITLLLNIGIGLNRKKLKNKAKGQ